MVIFLYFVFFWIQLLKWISNWVVYTWYWRWAWIIKLCPFPFTVQNKMFSYKLVTIQPNCKRFVLCLLKRLLAKFSIIDRPYYIFSRGRPFVLKQNNSTLPGGDHFNWFIPFACVSQFFVQNKFDYNEIIWE